MAEQPNQLLVRRGFEAFSTGDMDTLVQIIADDAVQIMPGNNVIAGEHKGREAILAMYARLFEETGGTGDHQFHGVVGHARLKNSLSDSASLMQ